MIDIIVNSAHTLASAQAALEHAYREHHYLQLRVKTGRQRSLKQNSALHVYCKLLADALNESGQDMRQVLNDDVDVPWSRQSVKDFLWRPIQKAMTGRESTTKPEKSEYTKIYETLNRHTAQKLGVSVAWPCKEGMESDGPA